MTFITKFIGVVIFGFVCLYILRQWILIPIGIILLFILIRFIADIYWKGKDDGKW